MDADSITAVGAWVMLRALSANDFRSNHFQIVPRSDKNRHPGWPTLCEICKGWAPLHSDAEESKTHHGLRRPAFHHILLLSEKTLDGNGSSAKSCREDP